MLDRFKISHVVDDVYHMCSDCICGKMSRLTFPVESNKSLFPFEKIHSEI